MNRDCAAGIVHLDHSLIKENSNADQDSRENPNDDRGSGRHEGAWGSNRDQSGKHPVTSHGDIRFSETEIPEHHSGRRTGHGGKIRVYCDYRNAKVCCCERRARIKAHPTEQENEGARDNEGEVVRGEWSGLAIRPIFTKAWTQDDRQRHGTKATDSMHHGRSSEVYVAVTQVHG